ncbi:hypothetical protein JF50_11365 [Pseudoalteromonas luteoviolacea]|uniref:Uncharacterized protein n=1 Tax=Pseudoalteromonas luteoviolacea TaxID=43657 RepID=A0A0C1Q762_9GAMM|nr:hypothetical protein [Pseudoalteromonas luteoviolacea]KID56536.1 hypothetical protein JF50_11365 [Pseudoalteromonas luteoviolacea]
MKALIIYCVSIFLLFNLSGCSPSKEKQIMLRQSEEGMSFHGLKKSRALEAVDVLAATFPELDKTKNCVD